MTQERATLEQRRAAFALGKVNGVKSEVAKYKTQLVKLPARLHTNGLGQTVAFYLTAGSGKPEAEICGWIEKWLGIADPRLAGKGLLECITGDAGPGADPALLYRQASTEARALAVWLKRFAEAFLEGEAE